jgi:ankyrin repeat protein
MQSAIEVAREFYVTGKLPEAPPAAAGAGRGGAGGGGGRGGAPEAAAGPGAGRAGQAPGPDGGAPQGANAETPLPNISAKGGLSALHHAVRQGYLGTTKALLDAGALLDEKSGDGHTPLLVALINGQFDVAMELISRGANVNTSSDSHGVTPLWATINVRWQPRTRFPQPQEMDGQKADYLAVMQALINKGADVNARIRVHPWYMVYTDCGNANCGLSNSAGSTAFWRAAYATDVEAMRFLVKNGADPNIPTFVARAAAGGRGGGGRGGGGRGGGPVPDGDNPMPTAAPVAAGALDPSGLPPVPGGGPGVFPLHAAAGSEYGEGFAGNAHRHAPDAWLATVKYLVEELGMDVNSRDNDGYTPMHHAAARGDNELIHYLVSKGADPKAVSRRGQTTVDMANGPVSRISPFPETIKLLEGMGAKNNHRCQSC